MQHGVTRDLLAVYFEYLEFLEMSMDRMRPGLAVVLECPDFRTSLFDRGIHAIRIHKAAVHSPQSVVVVEQELPPTFDQAHVDFRQLPHEIRNAAGVLNRRTNYIKPHDLVALIEQSSHRACPIVAHFQTIGQEDLIASIVL